MGNCLTKSRGAFRSRLGFVLAAAGSAVGLGNIWGFPTQAASNGGGAFLLTYLMLVFFLAYPVLMAELLIGRHSHRNMTVALNELPKNEFWKKAGTITGICGLLTASLILSFYSIVAGWIVGFAVAYPAEFFGFTKLSDWLNTSDSFRNLSLMVIFIGLTGLIVMKGVEDGIERWSRRLMPLLLLTLIALAGYVLTLDGAVIGLKKYLLPDVSKLVSGELLIDALGSSFFSLSLGVGTMLIYGSYLNDSEHIPSVGVQVALVDVGIAVLAGFLILPAMYVADARGVEIFDAVGELLSEDTLVFTVLPALFATLNTTGSWLATGFFLLLCIAALTSSISMLEVPVAYLVENHFVPRVTATLLAASIIALLGSIITLNFNSLFGLVVTISTRYSQPILGLFICIFAGWLWQRNELLGELKKNNVNAEDTLFWKLWPLYVKWLCPGVIGVILVQSIF